MFGIALPKIDWGKMVEKVPDIIREARQSPLGILALLIIVLGVIAVLWFDTASIRVRLSVFFTCLVFGSGGFLVVGWHSLTAKEANGGAGEVTGKVLNAVTQQPVGGAKVSLEAEGVPSVVYTDSEGFYRFKRSRSGVAPRVRILIDGYAPYDRTLSGESANGLEDIRLDPIRKPDGGVIPSRPATSKTTKPAPPPAEQQPIRIRADNFDRDESKNVRSNPRFGDGVIANSSGLNAPNLVVYHFGTRRGGNYELWVEYASGEERPVQIAVNDQIEKTDGLLAPTGPPGQASFDEQFQQEKFQCNVRLKAGDNTVSFSRDKTSNNSIPAIKTILFKPIR